MTDQEKTTYLNRNIGLYVPFYHIINGDSIAKILSVSLIGRTFEYAGTGSIVPLTMSFDDVVEFEFRSKDILSYLHR